MAGLRNKKGFTRKRDWVQDMEYDQMSLFEYIDPFTSEPVRKNKK